MIIVQKIHVCTTWSNVFHGTIYSSKHKPIYLVDMI